MFSRSPTPRCHRCGKTVYAAEQIAGPGDLKFHRWCYKCKSCNKKIEPSTLAVHENEVYCRACHSKNFGMRGYGHGVGAGVMHTWGPDGRKLNSDGPRPRASSQDLPLPPVQPTSRVGFSLSPKSPPDHENLQPETNKPAKAVDRKCAEAAPALDSDSVTACSVASPGRLKIDSSSPWWQKQSDEATKYSAADRRARSKTVPAFNQSQVDAVMSGSGGDATNNACKRCGKTAYYAERVKYAGSIYHKRCYRCSDSDCGLRLQPQTTLDHDDELYCKRCYAKHFGTKGYGHGVGAGVLHYTTK
jgi:hypothetical protein